MSLIKGFFQYPTIELHPTQLAIKEQVSFGDEAFAATPSSRPLWLASLVQLGCGCCQYVYRLGERLTSGYRYQVSSCELGLEGFSCRLRSVSFFNCKCLLVIL